MILNVTFVIAAILLSFAITDTAAFAQISVGGPAVQKSIDVFIKDEGKVHVIHKVGEDSSTRSVTLIEGTTSNIKVLDEEGNEIEHGVVGGFGGTAITIFPTSKEAFVSYDLDDVLFLKHGTTWAWDFLYLEKTTFHLPESVNLIFVNNTPVYFPDKKIFNCHGCQMTLEFVPDENKITEKIVWEDREFDVEIWASTELSSFSFDQPTKSISYDFDDSERWVTLIIPLELLGKPYQAWAGDEKIFTHQFMLDDEHAGVSLELAEPSKVSIIGATVIPEFPLILPIMLVAITMVILLQFRNKVILH